MLFHERFSPIMAAGSALVLLSCAVVMVPGIRVRIPFVNTRMGV